MLTSSTLSRLPVTGYDMINLTVCILIIAGQVIMDKNPGITCVVNKTNTIDSTYRNFQMEVLAGENNMVAKVRWRGSCERCGC